MTNPHDLEATLDADTPEKMRSEMLRLSYQDPLLSAVRDLADYNGLSGEDRYTILAYHLLRQNLHMKRAMLNDALTNLKPMMVANPKDIKR